MECSHVIAGARDSERLVLDDRDRRELLRRLAARLGPETLLAHCVLDTHVHVVVAGSASWARDAAKLALVGYTRSFNARHGRSGGLLRGPVEAMTARTPRELARQIVYVHENPVRTRPPIVSDDIHFEWSSARAYGGLSLARFTNVARALALLGKERRRIARRCPPLEGLAPARFPDGSVDLVLAAAAQTFEIAAPELAEAALAPEVVAARAVHVTLGRLEGFSDAHLAASLGRTPRRVSQIAAGPVDLGAVRIARTLLRVPALRARLRPSGSRALPGVGSLATR